MKKLLLFLFFAVVAVHFVAAQTCTPAKNLPDSLIGPYPPPFDPATNPQGGISDTACINKDFQFVVTLVIPSTFSIAGINLPIQNINLNPETAISNLPKGLDYVCNPPNCVFKADTSGCILLYGTVNDTAGVYDVKISGTLVTPLTSLPLTFPDATLFKGNYYLHVKPAGQCVTGTDDLDNREMSAYNRPNPFTGLTQIVVNSNVNGNFNFVVSDLVGKQLYREKVNLWEGENTIRYDGSNLAAGVYIYTITDGSLQFSGKMIVSK